MVYFPQLFAGLDIYCNQLILIGNQNYALTCEYKIRQTFVRAFVTPESFAVFRVNRRYAEAAFFVRFAVFDARETAAGSDKQNISDDRHFRADA